MMKGAHMLNELKRISTEAFDDSGLGEHGEYGVLGVSLTLKVIDPEH
jgi:hypothetical protein